MRSPPNAAQVADASQHTLPWDYAVAFSLAADGLHCEWSPDVPKGRRARRLLPHYRAARDAFLASIAPGNFAVVEI
jgi:hypothetical protein